MASPKTMKIQNLLVWFFKFLKRAFNYYGGIVSLEEKHIFLQEEIIELTNKEIDLLSEPGLTESAKKQNYKREYRSEKVYYGFVNNGFVLGNYGAIGVKNALFIEGFGFVDRLVKSGAYRNLFHLKKRTLNGSYFAFLTAPYLHNLYHIIIDELPKLYTFYQLELPIKVIIPAQVNAKYKELIKYVLFDLKHIEIVEIPETEKWNLEKIMIISNVTNGSSGYLRADILQFIREKLIKAYGISNKETVGTKIYISRRNAQKRRIINESELVPILENYGFRIVILEDLTVKSQFQLFFNCSVVIGPHGAGLTNLILAPTGTKVIEIQPTDHIKPHYMFLAKGCGLDYQLLKAGRVNEYLNFECDPVLLGQKIKSVL